MVLWFKRLHRIWYFTSVLLFFCIFFPVLSILSLNPIKNYSKIATIRRWISVLGANLAGVFFKVNIDTRIDWSKPMVLCPNHTSFLDITALTFLCPTAFSFIGKAELLNNPVTRIFFKTIDIPVLRESKISSFRAFQRANELIRSGRIVVIFPEGKIDDAFPPRIHPFKSGAFRIATQNDVPIVPIVIENAWRHFFDDGAKYGSYPGVIRIHVLEPIDTAHFDDTNANALEQIVFDRMRESWNSANRI